MAISGSIAVVSPTAARVTQAWTSRRGKRCSSGAPGLSEWGEPRLVVDSTEDLDVNVATLVSRLG